MGGFKDPAVHQSTAIITIIKGALPYTRDDSLAALAYFSTLLFPLLGNTVDANEPSRLVPIISSISAHSCIPAADDTQKIAL